MDFEPPDIDKHRIEISILSIFGNWTWVDTLSWVWIDTCCIDKTSSAELSEAINSMYHWYAKAKICYAYLSDISVGPSFEQQVGNLKTSPWFTRGWTSQELLAPKYVVFLNKDWVELGNRFSLSSSIADVTGIAPILLTHRDVNRYLSSSVAEKFPWTAHRKTTRIEDATYCLLGLFRQNMPLLYGEREQARLRLQLEIVRSFNDESIVVRQGGAKGETGLIARHRRLFESE